jgi:hypothetical protein
MASEAGAWTGFVSKTTAARPIVIDFSYETPDPPKTQFLPFINICTTFELFQD